MTYKWEWTWKCFLTIPDVTLAIPICIDAVSGPYKPLLVYSGGAGVRYLLAVLGSRGHGELLGDACIAARGRSDGHVLIGRWEGRKGQRNQGR